MAVSLVAEKEQLKAALMAVSLVYLMVFQSVE
jgi:hypothetical protein